MIALRPARLLATVFALAAALALALAAAAPARAGTTGPCTAAPTPGTYDVAVTSGALQRSAIVHVPPGLGTGHHAPLLIALHGAYGSGAGMQVYSGFSDLADTDGFIVAYPSAAGRFWNIDGAAGQPDDVAFISTLISTLKSEYCVDSRRVFAAGVSNGAGMVALLGCDLSTTFAGIAAVAGDYDKLPTCHLKRPVPLLEIHGTSDRVAPYRGLKGQATVDGVPPFVAAWALHDGCTGMPATRHLSGRTVVFRWAKCAKSSTVEHIRIVGGTHQWPGATPPDPGPPATISASATIWSFFSSLGSTAPVAAPPPSGPPPPGAPPPTTGTPQPSGGASL